VHKDEPNLQQQTHTKPSVPPGKGNLYLKIYLQFETGFIFFGHFPVIDQYFFEMTEKI